MATFKTIKGKPAEPTTKNIYLYAYDCFCKTNQIQWQKPYYRFSEKIPIIPTTENVNKIIGTATKRYTLIFTLLAETGAEAHELEITSRNQIDQQQGIISITGIKMHDSGNYKLKSADRRNAQRLFNRKHRRISFSKIKNNGANMG